MGFSRSTSDGWRLPGSCAGGWKTTVLLAPKIDFIELLRHRPELALRMLASMSQHLRVPVALLDELTLKDMESRLANCLLKRCPRPLPNDSVVIQLDRTKRVLTAEMGATSETLSRTMAKFRDQKLLQIKGKTLTVTKPRALQRLLQTNLGELQSGPRTLSPNRGGISPVETKSNLEISKCRQLFRSSTFLHNEGCAA